MALTSQQLAEFEMWFREYFDPDHEELPDPKYLGRWAEQHGEALLAELKSRPRASECPNCQHPRCEARCDLIGIDTGQLLPYSDGKPCPCCCVSTG